MGNVGSVTTAKQTTIAEDAWNAAKTGVKNQLKALNNLRPASIVKKPLKTAIEVLSDPKVQSIAVRTTIKPTIFETAYESYLGTLTLSMCSGILSMKETGENAKDFIVNNPIYQAGKAVYDRMTAK